MYLVFIISSWFPALTSAVRARDATVPAAHFRRARFAEGGSGKPMESQIRQTTYTRLILVSVGYIINLVGIAFWYIAPNSASLA